MAHIYPIPYERPALNNVATVWQPCCKDGKGPPLSQIARQTNIPLIRVRFALQQIHIVHQPKAYQTQIPKQTRKNPKPCPSHKGFRAIAQQKREPRLEGVAKKRAHQPKKPSVPAEGSPACQSKGTQLAKAKEPGSPKRRNPACQPKPWRRLVEAAGVEPASENAHHIEPTCVSDPCVSAVDWRTSKTPTTQSDCFQPFAPNRSQGQSRHMTPFDPHASLRTAAAT